jgi:hypothetical protein
MHRPTSFVLGAGVFVCALLGCPPDSRADTPGDQDRQLVFEVQGLACPAVAGLG